MNENGGCYMSLEKVKSYFRAYQMEDRVIELDVSSATVSLAALALHVQEARIAKTLSFIIQDKAILIVMAGDVKVQNSKYKKQFGKKAKMLSYEQTEQLVGHVPGGVCPFAINKGVEVYLDVSLQRFDTVFPACGSANSAIELTIPELEVYSCFKEWVDVCQIIE